MLLRIQYAECGRFDMVKPSLLDRLLESGGVKQFCRPATGCWVIPGMDRLRQSNRPVKNGERRV